MDQVYFHGVQIMFIGQKNARAPLRTNGCSRNDNAVAPSCWHGYLREGADKSLVRPNFSRRKKESIVSLERQVCSSA